MAKVELDFCHIWQNCIEHDFSEIEFYFELDFEKVKFQKDFQKDDTQVNKSR